MQIKVNLNQPLTVLKQQVVSNTKVPIKTPYSQSQNQSQESHERSLLNPQHFGFTEFGLSSGTISKMFNPPTDNENS